MPAVILRNNDFLEHPVLRVPFHIWPSTADRVKDINGPLSYQVTVKDETGAFFSTNIGPYPGSLLKDGYRADTQLMVVCRGEYRLEWFYTTSSVSYANIDLVVLQPGSPAPENFSTLADVKASLTLE